MAMRRSRIKLAPNLGAKARGPAASVPAASRPAPGASEVIKLESAKGSNVESSTVSAKNEPRELQIPVSPKEGITAKSEPADKGSGNSSLIKNATNTTITETSSDIALTNRIPVIVHAPIIAESAAPDETMGQILPADALAGVSKITQVTNHNVKLEGLSGKGNNSSDVQDGAASDQEVGKPVAAPRIRSRFPKARPNLTETGRGRIRHNSLSRSDDEEMRSPPAIQRAFSRPREPSISESTPSPQIASTIENDRRKDVSQTSITEPFTTEVVKVPNINNSLGIDLGSNTKRNVKTERDDESRKKPKKMEWIEGPVDRTKLTMRDLIHMNPVGNPMKSALADKERRKKLREKNRTKSEDGEAGDVDDTQSIVSTATLQEERGEPDIAEPPVDPLEPITKPEPEADTLTAVPQVRIGANGEIILNESSLFIDNKDPDQDSKAVSMEIIHESDFCTSTMGYHRKSSCRLWTEMETKKFYLALSAVGTDFSLMGNLFPKRTRTELKRKFKREEKTNRYLVDKAIREQQHFDQEFFDNLVKLEIDEPVPKKRQKRQRSGDDNEEDQENRSDSETRKKKKTPSKIKEEKDGDKEGGKKKRGRKPKATKEKEGDEDEENTEDKPTKSKNRKSKVQKEKGSDGEDTNQTGDPKTKCKRPRRSKKVIAQDGCEEEGETATPNTSSDPSGSSQQEKSAQPEANCSPENEDIAVPKRKQKAKTKSSTQRNLDGSEPKPKRQRKKKTEKKDDGLNVESVTVEEEIPPAELPDNSLDIRAFNDLIEYNETEETEVSEETPYVFVASSEADGDGAEQVLHVYLVSPDGTEATAIPGMIDLGHITPQQTTEIVTSPEENPSVPYVIVQPEVPAGSELSGTCATSLKEAIEIHREENTPHSQQETIDIALTHTTETDTAKDTDEAPVSVNVTALAESSFTIVKEKTAVASKEDSIPTDDRDKVLTEEVDPIIDSSNPAKDIQRKLHESDHESDHQVRTKDVADIDRTVESVSDNTTTVKSINTKQADKVMPSLTETTQDPKMQAQPENSIISIPTTDTNNDSRQNISTTEKTVVKDEEKPSPTPVPDVSKSQLLTGRRRRITAMPKIPVGKRRPTAPVPAVTNNARSERTKSVDEMHPIDEITAGGILLEMSNSDKK